MSDDALLAETLAFAQTMIVEQLTTAVQHGVSPATLAVLVERSFDGRTKSTCIARPALTAAVGADARLHEDMRRTLAVSLASASSSEVPVVVIVQCEGYCAGGVVRLEGTIVVTPPS